MKLKTLLTSSIVSVSVLISGVALANSVAEGKKIAFHKKKGNCLACHMVEDGDLPGNTAPPLLAMKARFPNKKDLFDKIWDARVKKSDTMMPPFGKHKILSDDEIHKVVDYLYTL